MASRITMLKRPLVTEKIMGLNESFNKYGFEVHPDMNKIEISKVVEDRFNVKVKNVRTMNNIGKMKRMGKTEGRRSNWKKAIVTLVEGYKIELFEGV